MYVSGKAASTSRRLVLVLVLVLVASHLRVCLLMLRNTREEIKCDWDPGSNLTSAGRCLLSHSSESLGLTICLEQLKSAVSFAKILLQ